MTQQPQDRDAERRQATVLFADISGFTAMSEKMDPEDVTVVMNDCFAMLEAAVRAHGGVVDKYIGDCIMALFGVPNAIEDAPKQAVNAAIEMRNRLEVLKRELRIPLPLDIHSGVNTGLVVAGEVGGETKRDFTVMGDTVNLASRLKDASPKGAIWVGFETYRYTRGDFDYRELAPLTLKGKERRVPAYEVLSVTETLHRAKPATERTISSAFVGRERDLALLSDCLARLEAGKGGIVTLLAEAGLGKSRLLGEMATLDTARRATLLEGRSLAIGQTLSFHPFVDLLRRWAGIEEVDGEQDAQQKLESAIGRLFQDRGGEIFPFVATLMGMRLTGLHAQRVDGIEGEARETLIRKTMRELFQRVAEERPVVVVLEDLHWADDSSLKLLESLLRLITEVPILFVLACRPDHVETTRRILAYVREHHEDRHDQIELQPLNDQQCQTLVSNLLRVTNLPHRIRELITAKADGNPFYIEEVVRSLIDDGVITHAKGGTLRVTENIDSVLIPGTIQGVIMTRVDRLAPSARQLLQIASVIGRSFHQRVIAAVAPADVDLAAELAYLKERQLLLERRTRATATVRRQMLVEEVEYVFTHALLQETIYGSILQKTRKELHVRVAEAIERLFADRIADFHAMLAFHFSRAERFEKAEEYLFRAGDEAVRSAASSEALGFFKEASRLYLMIHGEGGEPQKKARLEKNMGLALMNSKSDLAECVEHFNRALEHLGEHVPRTSGAMWRRFVTDLAAVLYRLYVRQRARRRQRPNDIEILEVLHNRARAQVTTDPQRMFFDTIRTLRRMNQTDTSCIADACGMYAGSALLFSFSGVSFSISSRILDVAKGLIRPGNAKDEFIYRAMRFLHHYLQGDWDDVHAIDESLVNESLRYGALWDVNMYLGLDCERRIHRGEFAAADRVMTKLADIVDTYGLDFARANREFMVALVALEQRDLATARAAVERYDAGRHETLLHLLALGTRAKIDLLMGDRAGAATRLAEAEILLARGQVPPYFRAATVVSRLIYDLGTLEAEVAEGAVRRPRTLERRADRSARSARRVAAACAWERVEVYRLTGVLAWLRRREDRAVRWWTQSIAEGERLHAIPELARTHMEIAQRLGEPARRCHEVGAMDAMAHRARARDLFSSVGLVRCLERLDDLAVGRVRRPAA